jgi:hypothetical protein
MLLVYQVNIKFEKLEGRQVAQGLCLAEFLQKVLY